jgi:shikimate kinase
LKSAVALPDNIALTGFMGTGKSAVSRALANLCSYTPVDVDIEIEKKAGLSISAIFESRGEPAFREMEAEAIRAISKNTGQVISTGGGAVLRKDNMDVLRSGGALIVNLMAQPETVYERIKQTGHRPLLQGDNPLAKIKELMAARQEYYKNADIVIVTDKMTVDQIAKSILEKARSL